MAEQLEPSELPARPRSAFASAPEDTARGKDGRKLGGATNPQFNKSFWTDERKELQRQKAKQMIAEGRFGAANGFHRRKTKRFQEIAAEHAQQRAEEIVQRLDQIIFSPSKRTSAQDILRAIEMYGKFEDWAVKNSREDEKEFRAMTNQQLDSRLMEIMGEALGLDLAGAIDADVVEEELVGLPPGYDPMDSELGGDRLAALDDDDDE